ncbi:hypothetical protein [Rufibacter roseus]|uniref:Tetratricopeptide repeat protein n=1 Tax=Rufibacter roseus TaxID=1567108 RepID=A0ABW2DP26_9BACT|nr:hypothetical protein [Rufibacter roseus]
MEELKKLVQIINKKGTAESPLLDLSKKSQSKEWLLYNGLAQGSITSEKDALEILYSGSSSGGFKMVKSRLRKKLLNQLYFLDFSSPGNNLSHSVEHACIAKIYQARVLLNLGAYDLAEPVLKEVISLGKQISFYDVVLFSLKTLLLVYTNLGEKNLFYKTQQKIQEFQELFAADHEVEQLYLESKVQLGQSVKARKQYLANVDDVLERMEQLWRKAQSFNSFRYYYQLSIWAQELKGNFEQIIELTENSERLLKEYSINSEFFDHRYNKYIQVYAHLRAKKLEEGLKLASINETAFNPTSNNWFAYMENYYLLAMHAKEYLVAHTVLQKIFGNTFFNKINKLAQERWHLFYAYLHFVSPQEGQTFKFNYLLRNLPSYSNDKEGYNVAILILQVMYYLYSGDTESLIYRMEALKKYAHKHFKDSFSERSRTFFKLLALMVQNDFQPMVMQRKGQYLFQKLQRISPPGDAYAEIEIIPYEHLWELIIQRLKEKKLNV